MAKNLCKSVDESQQLASQLTDQYRKAISGTRDILIFGAMMLQLPRILSRQITADASGKITGREPGLKGWIEEHCPDIHYSTAYSFFNLARGLVEIFALPERIDLPRLLSAPVEELSKHDAHLRAKVDEFLEGKSKRQLEIGFGIRKAKTTSGGNTVLMLWLRDKHPELTDITDVDDIPKELLADYEAFRQEYLESHSVQHPKPLEYYQQRWAERITAIRQFVLDKEEFRKLDETQLRAGVQALKDCLTYIKKNCNM